MTTTTIKCIDGNISIRKERLNKIKFFQIINHNPDNDYINLCNFKIRIEGLIYILHILENIENRYYEKFELELNFFNISKFKLINNIIIFDSLEIINS